MVNEGGVTWRPSHRDQGRLHWEGGRSGSVLTTLPLLQASAAPHRGLLPFSAFPVRRESPRRTSKHSPACGSLHGSLYSGLIPGSFQGTLRAAPLGTTLYRGAGSSMQQLAHAPRETRFKPKCPHVNPNQYLRSSAEPNEWGALTREHVN